MHPYIEIIFSVALILLGIKMLRKLTFLRQGKYFGGRKTYITEKYKKLLSQKLSIRLWILLFVLFLVISSFILIEMGQMIVIWNW